MTPEQMDRIARDHLDQVNKALRGLPRPLRAQVMEGVASHVAEARAVLQPQTEAELRDLLDRIGQPDEIAAEARGPQETAARTGPRLLTPVVASALGAVVAVAALVIVLAQPAPRSASPASKTYATALISYVPTPTRPVLLATGRAGGLDWGFWAQEIPLSGNVTTQTTEVRGFESPAWGIDGGLCTSVTFLRSRWVLAGGGPCGDPRQLSRFDVAQFGPGTGLDAAFVMGVTSVPATAVRIDFSGTTRSLVESTLHSKEFPKVRFFVVSLPHGAISSIAALGPDGRALYRYGEPGLGWPSGAR